MDFITYFQAYQNKAIKRIEIWIAISLALLVSSSFLFLLPS